MNKIWVGRSRPNITVTVLAGTLTFTCAEGVIRLQMGLPGSVEISRAVLK